jgi:hypothetical protein
LRIHPLIATCAQNEKSAERRIDSFLRSLLFLERPNESVLLYPLDSEFLVAAALSAFELDFVSGHRALINHLKGLSLII